MEALVFFSLAPEQHILANKQNNLLPVHSCIAIFHKYCCYKKYWGYHNKTASMKSLGVYYWYVKMPGRGYVEHRLEYFAFYVQKHIAHLTACSGHPPGLRRAARGTRISETCLLLMHVLILVNLCSKRGTRYHNAWQIASHPAPIMSQLLLVHHGWMSKKAMKEHMFWHSRIHVTINHHKI